MYNCVTLLFGKRTVFSVTCVTNAVKARFSTSQCMRCVGPRGKKKYFIQPGPKGLTSYFLLIFPVVTFGLGTWQVQRLQWKLNLIKTLEEASEEAPVPLPHDLKDVKALEYRRVNVRGEFDHSRELFLLPRQRWDSKRKHSGSLMTMRAKKEMGAHVVTPFKLANRDLTIMVNRGWVHNTNMRPAKRPEGQVAGEVELVGLVRLSERGLLFGVTGDKDTWMVRDIEKMAETCHAAPVFIDAVTESTVPGGPIGGQTILNVRNEHLSYIITWYGLSFATGVMCYMHWLKK